MASTNEPTTEPAVDASAEKPAPRRSTRTAASRAEAAKKAAATRARKKAEAAAAAAAEAEAAAAAQAAEDAALAVADDPAAGDVADLDVTAATEQPQSETVDADPELDPVVLAAQRGGAPAQAPAPVPSFGLLFQPPTPVPDVPARGVAPELEDEALDEAEDREDTTEDVQEVEAEDRGGRGRRSRGRRSSRSRRADEQDIDEAATIPEDDEAVVTQGETSTADDTETDVDADMAGEDDTDDTEGGRRRRRRGGRGRRRSGRGAGEDSDARSEAEDAQDDTDTDTDAARDRDRDVDSEDAEQSSSGRRRRRRRRGGDGEDSGSRRESRESATGIKGSTRLEAKRQRRREGREAGRRRTIITEAEFLARRESVERTMVVRDRGDHTQIAVLEDGVLVEHYISGGASASGAAGAPGASMAGNVYLGRVQNVLPSMEAAFVDIGKGRNAVLYAGEVNWDAAGLESKARRIEDALSSGQSVVVQVTKDPIGHKGARLTSQISLPGRYLVYVPDGSMTGISRKLPDTERARLKKILKQVVPDDAGVIVRTAAEGASEAELTADVERLRRAWEKIQNKAKSRNAPILLHGEPDLTTRVVRDVFNEDFAKLVVSGDRAWESISDYVEEVAPDLADRLHKWTGEKDVFAEHRIDEQLAKAMDRKVWLPSGGSLVIDRTEAMTVIDVNTGKFTGSGGNLEETVTKNNIEAAEEIVRQLRLRDIGGIIVVDFIDMVLESNRDLVVRRLLECLGRDRTKHQVAEVTSLGLVQMTRKRVGAGLVEVFSEPCEHCNGRGILVSTEPLEKSTVPTDVGHENRGRRNARRAKAERFESKAAPAPSGPTPAQIAAAAYAAAVQSHTEDSHEDDAPMDREVVEAIVAEQLSEPQVTEAVAEVAAPESAAPASATGEGAPRQDAPRRTGRAPRLTGRVGAIVTTVDADEPQAVVVEAEVEAPVAPPAASTPTTAPAPKKRRRAVSTSVVTTASSEAAVFTATDVQAAEQAHKPLTVSAAEAAKSEGVTAAPVAQESSAPKKPRRAARRAAGSPAGPPTSHS